MVNKKTDRQTDKRRTKHKHDTWLANLKKLTEFCITMWKKWRGLLSWTTLYNRRISDKTFTIIRDVTDTILDDPHPAPPCNRFPAAPFPPSGSGTGRLYSRSILLLYEYFIGATRALISRARSVISIWHCTVRQHNFACKTISLLVVKIVVISLPFHAASIHKLAY